MSVGHIYGLLPFEVTLPLPLLHSVDVSGRIRRNKQVSVYTVLYLKYVPTPLISALLFVPLEKRSLEMYCFFTSTQSPFL